MQVLCLVGAGAEGLALPDAQVRWSCRVAQPGTPGTFKHQHKADTRQQ